MPPNYMDQCVIFTISVSSFLRTPSHRTAYIIKEDGLTQLANKRVTHSSSYHQTLSASRSRIPVSPASEQRRKAADEDYLLDYTH